MKYGVRKPNLKKSIKARTTGKVKRQVKKAINPLYGKKGMGIVNDPKKAAYNAVYNRTTVGVSDIAKGLTAANGNPAASSSTNGPLHAAVRMATISPARMMGLDKVTGSLEVGKDADIVVFDPDVNILETIVKGTTVYQK